MHRIQLWEPALLAMASFQSTILKLNAPNPTIGASLLAKAACQPAMLYLNAPNPIVGASPAGDGVLSVDHFEAECTEFNCRSEPARDGCLTGDPNLPEYPSHASYNFFRNLRS
jgi:hypothetical protein